MKTRVKYILTMGVMGASLAVAVFPMMVSAQVPMMINYQGQLTDDMGTPLNGTYSMSFYLYEVAAGGSAIWSETHAGVEVADGIYTVQLGAVTPFTADDVDGAERYLEVVVSGETLSPRQRLTSVAYAIKTAVADAVVDGGVTTVMIEDGTLTAADMQDGEVLAEIIDDDGAGSGLDADKLDGYDASDFAQADQTYTQAQVNSIVAGLQAQIDELKTLLAGVTRAGNDITFSGVNVHIVDGTDSTDGPVNGLGNLIVGYNELRASGNDRTGSHNIIVGSRNNYSAYGGLVAGYLNSISNSYSSVSGGVWNTASGVNSSVSGGIGNTASGLDSSVSGGYYNTASGSWSSVSGGSNNQASGVNSSVSGGGNNIASGNSSVVTGGGGSNAIDANIAFADYSVILGGFNNLAGDGICIYDDGVGRAVCTGGSDHSIGIQATVSGGYTNQASGSYSSVSGGYRNTASGGWSSVGGGYYDSVSGDWDWRAGDDYFSDN